jgi:NDP-sugar pyrophosphorylase family protein
MINIVVPMAGNGSRFVETGQIVPKPLIEVLHGKRMIEYVIDYATLPEAHRFIFVCLEDHHRAYDFHRFLQQNINDYELIVSKNVTRGPAATALLAKEFVDDGCELIIAYCDSFYTRTSASFLRHSRERRADGALITYPSESAMDGYAEIDGDGRVLRTAEKEIISATAAAGFYYFREGRDFVAAASAMMSRRSDRCTELFVCPVYNELIRRGKVVISVSIDRQQRIEMGTPEDLAKARHRLMRQCLPSQAPASGEVVRNEMV